MTSHAVKEGPGVYAVNTLDYYDENAEAFVQGTLHADMNRIRQEFLNYLPEGGGTILDLGCGSGRDSLAFRNAGYEVVAVDGSKELCRRACALIGQPVVCSTFQQYTPAPGVRFGGIWACASLLHLMPEELVPVISKLTDALLAQGIWYMSFKYGEFRGERGGRYFTDLTESSLTALLEQVPALRLLKTSITQDVRPGRDGERWLNAFLMRT